MDFNNIAIVTPLRNEISNLPRLFSSIANLDTDIYLWIIVENDSVDGSAEWLDRLIKPNNVNHIIVINHKHEISDYALGVKYSSVVNIGFNEIIRIVHDQNLILNYVGILDADCFPDRNYYSTLIEYMDTFDVDISSGFGFNDDGKYDGESKSWVRGNCRLWRWKCFADAGYLIGPSADALSVTRAELKGYKSYPCSRARYICRDTGGRVNFEYYGYSSYYRGITPFYASLKTINYFAQLRFREGYGYFKGFFSAQSKSMPVIEDRDIYNYFNGLLFHKLKRFFSRF